MSDLIMLYRLHPKLDVNRLVNFGTPQAKSIGVLQCIIYLQVLTLTLSTPFISTVCKKQFLLNNFNCLPSIHFLQCKCERVNPAKGQYILYSTKTTPLSGPLRIDTDFWNRSSAVPRPIFLRSEINCSVI